MRKRRLAPLLLAAAVLLGGRTADGASLTGTVVRKEDGQPVRGASLWAAPGIVHARTPPSVMTGADGSFEIPDPPAGAFALWVCAEGYLPWAQILGSAAAQTAPIAVSLEPAAEIRGRVLDAEGRPVSGVSVQGDRDRDWLSSSPPWMTLHPCGVRERMDTDRTGRFALAPLKPGNYALRVQTSDQKEGEIPDVEAPPGSVVEGLEIRLRPAAPDEPPPQDDSFTPTIALPSEEVPSPKAAAAPQDFRDCKPTRPPEPSEQSPVVAIPTAAAEPFSPRPKISEGGTAWLRGRVLASDGRPVAGATVRTRSVVHDPWAVLYTYTYRWIGAPEARTDAEGRFSLGPLYPDRVVAVAHADPWTGRSDPVRVDEGETVEVEVRLQIGSALSGRVLDQAGQPVERASVSVAGQSAVSAVDGSFRFIGLPPGPAWISARDLPYEELVRDIEIGDGETRVDLVLAPDQPCGCVPVLARGRVTGPDGVPVAGAEISTLRGDEARSAADGSFEIRLPMLYPEEVTVRKPGLAVGAVLVAGVPAEGLEIRLEPAASITGRVRGLTEGEPEPEELVWLHSTAGPILSTPIRPDGTFEATQVPSGTWELTAKVSEREAKATVVLPPGRREVRADLVLPPIRPVSGRVVDELGRPIAGASLVAWWEDHSGSMTSDAAHADGSFELRLPDGAYHVIVSQNGFQDGEISTLRVQGGPVTGLEVRLERATILHGRLLGLPRWETPRVTIRRLSSEHSMESNGWTTLDRYSIPGLGPGLWTIEASIRSCTIRKTFEIPAGATEMELDLDMTPTEAEP